MTLSYFVFSRLTLVSVAPSVPIVCDGYVCDWGPNGFLDRVPLTLQLVEELGLQGQTSTRQSASRQSVYLPPRAVACHQRFTDQVYDFFVVISARTLASDNGTVYQTESAMIPTNQFSISPHVVLAAKPLKP